MAVFGKFHFDADQCYKGNKISLHQNISKCFRGNHPFLKLNPMM